MLLGLVLAGLLAQSQAEIPRGTIVNEVQCAADPSQTYALYLPSGYTADREWPVIFAFDPGGRGLNPVERYQAAAEKYGYIVAGSNNSRNGSWEVTRAAVAAMTHDVTVRFSIAEKREYVAGMSGGARVALGIGLSSPNVAGVIASSAGYPDNSRRRELTFPLFETAGTEDFNYLEMRALDRDLRTPHHLAIFEGPHTWLSSELAMQAVEWMEIQAMKSGRKPMIQPEVDAIFALRTAAIPPDRSDAATLAAVSSLVDDFTGLENVERFAKRATELQADKRVREEQKKAEELETKEQLTEQVIQGEESLLGDQAHRAETIRTLRGRWKALSEQANGPADTPERRMARRALSGLAMGVTTKDPDYLAIVKEYRLAAPAR